MKMRKKRNDRPGGVGWGHNNNNEERLFPTAVVAITNPQHDIRGIDNDIPQDAHNKNDLQRKKKSENEKLSKGFCSELTDFD